MATTPTPLAKQGYHDFTWAAFSLGLVQGVVLNTAFVYTALKLGFSIGGSAIASIIGYVLLRMVWGRCTIVENSINQTIASGINSAGIGVVFVLPAAYLLHTNDPSLDFPLLPMLIASVGGAMLGVILITPLRRQLIELERLRFPTGTAVATIIRSTSAGVGQVKLLLWGCVLSAAWKLLMLSDWLMVPGLLEADELNLSLGVLPAYVSPYLYLSLMNFAAGLLSGRAGLPFFAGGLLGWWIISPGVVMAGWVPPELDGAELMEFIYTNMLRPLGIGMLIGAAGMELLRTTPMLFTSLRHLFRATLPVERAFASDEIPLRLLMPAALLAWGLLFLATWSCPGVSLPQAALSAFFATLWMALASLIVAEATGLTDISPISGISLVSVTLMLVLLDGNIIATVLLTVAIAVAVGQAADMMQDFKTGFLVGSRPLVQQVAQLSIAWIGVLVAFAVLHILWQGAGAEPGFGPGTALPAPQATALTEIIETVHQGTQPTDKFVLGAFVGLLFGAAPVAGLGVLAGLAMYLPFSITLGYGLGCLTQMLLQRYKGEVYCEQKLVPLGAGLIIGEALLSVGHAGYAILRGAV